MYCRKETIKNKAAIIFDVLGKAHTVESNEVAASKVCISVRKEQSCNVVFAGDKICYKVVICNESCINLYNLNFRDRLEEDVHYEKNSFKVNDVCQSPEIIGNSLCYRINELKAHEEIIITFDVEVE